MGAVRGWNPPPTTQETRACKTSGGDKESTGGTGTAAPPRPQQGMAAVGDSMGTLHRHTSGTDGVRPENGMHSHDECGLLAPTGPVVDPAAMGNQVSGDGHEANIGTAYQVWR